MAFFRALQDGYIGGVYVRANDTFEYDFPKGQKHGSWMKEISRSEAVPEQADEFEPSAPTVKKFGAYDTQMEAITRAEKAQDAAAKNKHPDIPKPKATVDKKDGKPTPAPGSPDQQPPKEEAKAETKDEQKSVGDQQVI